MTNTIATSKNKEILLQTIKEVGKDNGMDSIIHLFDLDLTLDDFPQASQLLSNIILNSDFANEDDYGERYADAINDITWSLEQHKHQSNYPELSKIAKNKIQKLKESQQALTTQLTKLGDPQDNLLIDFDDQLEHPKLLNYQDLFNYIQEW